MGVWVGVLPMRGGGVVLTMSGVVGVVTRIGGAVFLMVKDGVGVM